MSTEQLIHQPLVSIVMPVYDGSEYLDLSIKSVLEQSYANWELICVDDTSTDHSYSILQGYAAADPRIKAFQKENEKFGNRATKYGLQYCSGDFFVYMSQDDMLSRDLLEDHLRVQQQYQLEAVVPRMKYYNIKTDESTDFTIACEGTPIDGRQAFVLSLDWRIHGFAMWAMDLVRKVGWGTETLNDDEYTTRMLFFNAKRVGFSRGIFYYHNHNPNAITVKWSLGQLDFVTTDAKLYRFVLTNNFEPGVVQVVCDSAKNNLIRAVLILASSYKKIDSIGRKSAITALVRLYEQHQALIGLSKKNIKERISLSCCGIFRLSIWLKCNNV